MRNLILAAAAIVALSFATSTVRADHTYYRPRCAPYVTPYQAYRYSPTYTSRYRAYHSPYYRGHSYYGYPGYSSSSFGVHGRNFSLHFGF